MLDELISCIETMKNRINTHGASLRENEIRTRTQLIDPQLCALGWDVSDPSIVTPEYSVTPKRADYALLKPDGKPVAVLEAKALKEELTIGHREQMVGYAV